MADLSSHLSSWMIVPVLICILLLVCFPVTAQVNREGHGIIDSTSTHLTTTIQFDSLHARADSVKKHINVGVKSLVGNARGMASGKFQKDTAKSSDTLPGQIKRKLTRPLNLTKKLSGDSLRTRADSAAHQWLASKKNSYASNVKSAKNAILGLFRFPERKLSDSSAEEKTTKPDQQNYKPLVGWNGGYISYNYNYRSSVDTPFAENNIGQHIVTGSFGTMVAKTLPVNVNYFIRRSNSTIYRDITDIQVSFDAAGFRNQLVNRLRQKVQAYKPASYDSLLQKMAGLKSAELLRTGDWLTSPFNLQKLHEYNELVQIDSSHPESRPSDSASRKQKELLVSEARAFLKIYDSTKVIFDGLTGTVDSLERKLSEQRHKLDQYRQIANGKFNNWTSYSKWKNDLNHTNPGGLELSEKYRWLMGVRNFSVGKTPVNYSELTARNISVTGFNFEYNSWYYVAVAAGAIDYRFRDFVLTNTKTAHQYMVLLRAGIGRLERNYFILSYFTGRKQLYNQPVNSSQSNTIAISGIGAEAKYQLTRNSYIITEVAQSIAPDYRSTPPQENGKFTFSGSINKAASIKIYSAFPNFAARFEGMYKYTGANFQSFNTYQTNAALKTWYLKWDQSFLKRKLKVTAALRSNEFSNPYILQNYKSNTVFKSINAVFRVQKWPVISVGYMPMSQLSVVGQQVVENRFQTLTASLNHFYKLGTRQAFTLIVYNKFYNGNTDTASVYFNAVNIYVSQNAVFKFFTAGIGIAESKSSQYHLTSGEITLQVPVLQRAAVGFAVKINHFNEVETKTGARCSLDLNIIKKTRIALNYEKMFLPGSGGHLINSDIGNILFTRSF